MTCKLWANYMMPSVEICVPRLCRMLAAVHLHFRMDPRSWRCISWGATASGAINLPRTCSLVAFQRQLMSLGVKVAELVLFPRTPFRFLSPCDYRYFILSERN
ncbi:hypothetical protein XELAEV_18032403mg [Xenopus laevis]|uniref:Uncharacterized protein n=1 Tax=Xenopus laevis TaxID=8355 RepID=A0A974CRC2_XENLA|nr:hypothetical protein XELAEV_18032403mg [Xenopus laevis]